MGNLIKRVEALSKSWGIDFLEALIVELTPASYPTKEKSTDLLQRAKALSGTLPPFTATSAQDTNDFLKWMTGDGKVSWESPGDGFTKPGNVQEFISQLMGEGKKLSVERPFSPHNLG
jgi:hypothetical protein